LHWLYLPVLLLLLLSANLCVYHIAYAHTRTPLFGEPSHHPKHTQREFQFVCLQPYRPKQKKLTQKLPRSLRTCLKTSNNGMFQGHRNRDHQPNARTRAHVCMETCLPRARLFIRSV
jgi:hypothetical protein